MVIDLVNTLHPVTDAMFDQPLVQIRHARYIDPSVPYHVVTKTFGDNLFLLSKKGMRVQAKGTRRYMFLFN